jgi:hypothetical protein
MSDCARKKPPSEFVTFWADIATFGRKHVHKPAIDEYSSPEELSIRARISASMRLRKQASSKAKAAKKNDR